MMFKVYCYKCKSLLGFSGLELFSSKFLGWVDDGITWRRKLFCNEDCYNEYLKNIFAEEYKGNSIYYIIRNDVKYYVPYIQCNYWFESLEDCKRRIDDNKVGIYRKVKE